MMDGEIDFLIVVRGLLLAFDQQKTKLAAIGADGEIAVGARVSVIPPRARGFRRKRIALGLARGNHRGTLFHCAVVQRVDGQPVPMDDVRISAAVGHVDAHRNAFAQTKKRPGNLAVVAKRLDAHVRADLQRTWLDAKRVVSFRCGALSPASSAPAKACQGT